MAVRVVQWGTGVVGAAAASKIIDHPRLEIVGCFAHGRAKVGQDVGVLAGRESVGVIATDSLDAIIALKPDCVLYMPLVWSVDDMVRILEAGINMVSTANFITGRSYGKADQARLDAAARKGGVSLYGTGINPGLLDSVALVLTGGSGTVRRIVVRESVDATHYASGETWVALGFGGPADAPGLSDRVKARTLVFVDVVEMLADALKVKLDDIAFRAEYAIATEDLSLGYMDIARGTVCGLDMAYAGMSGGRPVIEAQQMWRLGHAMEPDWQAEGYVIEIDGTPGLKAQFHHHADPTSGGMTTAMNAVHAIEAVCEARPGIVTAADLPIIRAAWCVEGD